jgi:hypothetical protein
MDLGFDGGVAPGVQNFTAFDAGDLKIPFDKAYLL